MIFVTVGTHEQQFNRLVQEIDSLKGDGLIEDEVIIQTGFSTYEPKYCKWSKLISQAEMQHNVEQARIVITHGGPASFIAPLQIGKIPVVVPRQKKYDEHVNNHQLEFCKSVESRMGNIIVVEEISELENVICNYEKEINKRKQGYSHNNEEFNKKLEQIVKELV